LNDKNFFCNIDTCGPNGPQCPACASFQARAPKNGEGYPVFRGTTAGSTNLLYCGITLGVEAIPGSDGRCGTNNGPQCDSCKAYQTVARINAGGVPVARGNTPDSFDLFFCGQFIGTEDLPSSDGYCGPNSGPQCAACREYQQNPGPEPVAPEVPKREPVAPASDATASVVAVTDATASGVVTNAHRFEWRQSLLRSLVVDGLITKDQYRAKNKENKAKFEIQKHQKKK